MIPNGSDTCELKVGLNEDARGDYFFFSNRSEERRVGKEGLL